MKNLAGPEKRKLVGAFADAGLLGGGVTNASAIDDRGYYDLAAVDTALKTFPTMIRIDLKMHWCVKGWLR
jgi:hypothetical protein